MKEKQRTVRRDNPVRGMGSDPRTDMHQGWARRSETGVSSATVEETTDTMHLDPQSSLGSYTRPSTWLDCVVL